MEKSAVPYLSDALVVIRRELCLILLPTILTAALSLQRFFAPRPTFMVSGVMIIALVIVLPLIYGQYTEIVLNGKKDAWTAVFRAYWVRAFVLALILKAPIVLVMLWAPGANALRGAMSFLIELLSIYIVPLVFVKKEIVSPIKIGLKDLLGNLKFSAPLIAAAGVSFLLPVLGSLLFRFVQNGIVIHAVRLVIVVICMVIDYSVFIAVLLILKEKILSGQE